MKERGEVRSIREWRAFYRETLQEFAQRVDVSISALSLWERGVKVPRARTQRRIAEQLGVKVEQITWPGEEKNLAA